MHTVLSCFGMLADLFQLPESCMCSPSTPTLVLGGEVFSLGPARICCFFPNLCHSFIWDPSLLGLAALWEQSGAWPLPSDRDGRRCSDVEDYSQGPGLSSQGHSRLPQLKKEEELVGWGRSV